MVQVVDLQTISPALGQGNQEIVPEKWCSGLGTKLWAVAWLLERLVVRLLPGQVISPAVVIQIPDATPFTP